MALTLRPRLLSTVAVLTAGVLLAGGTTASAGSAPDSTALPVAAPAATSTPTDSLVEIEDFGDNPSGLGMYAYVPADRPAKPALLVVLHYCSGSGPEMYYLSDYEQYAKRYGFIAIYPSASRADGCFDVFGDALVRGGGGNPDSVVSMVRYAQKTWGTDPSRTFTVGYSSGAELVSELLATYPDVFAAGSIMAGSPFGCYVADDGNWNTQCETGQTKRSAKRWGDQVRAAYPGFTGTCPAVQIFHGTADTRIPFAVFAEETKQWVNVTGAKKSQKKKPRRYWTRTQYRDAAQRLAVETIAIKNGTHSIAWSEDDIEQYPITFFGLDKG
jgi:poly(hydroxyalkanoate) depolymerase family esterase